MRKARFSYRSLAILCALLGMTLVPGVKRFVAASPTLSGSYVAADIRSEVRVLDAFVVDLSRFDKRCVELGKQSSLTQSDFDSQQRTAEDLRRRVATVQNSLQSIVRKLKASGEFDRLDDIIVTNIIDGSSNTFFRREGFKKILETAALHLSSDANQISGPLDLLRSKLRAQARGAVFEVNKSSLSFRPIRVAYHPGPVLYDLNLRCRVAWLRLGFGKAFTGEIPKGAQDAVNCHCLGVQSACSAS